MLERYRQEALVRDMEELDPVELLRREYFQCLDPESLTLPEADLLRLPETQNRIYHQMFDESSSRFAPPVRYRFRVLKKIISALERAIQDPEEDVGHPCGHESSGSNFFSLHDRLFPSRLDVEWLIIMLLRFRKYRMTFRNVWLCICPILSLQRL